MRIVLIGMPSSGKTTVGRILADRMCMRLADTDRMAEEAAGMAIADLFRLHGEDAFRDMETGIYESLRDEKDVIISAGGGAVVRERNMEALSQGSIVVWIDRDIELLEATASRPLSSSREKLEKVYAERKHLYERYSDIRIVNNGTPEEAAARITRIIGNIAPGGSK